MAQYSFPFAEKPAGEAEWAKMAKHWMNTGVLKGVFANLEVYADGTGMQVKVAEGAAWVQGFYFESTALEVLPISPADPNNPRIDRVILRLDTTTKNIQLAVIQGTPAATPTFPSLTQNAGRWEITLAQVRVDKGVSTIAAGKVTDERVYILKNDYPGNLLSIGYTQLPNGLILQWGYLDLTGLTANAWASRTITFPIAFNLQCYAVFPSMYASSGAYGTVDVGYLTKTQFTAYVKPETAGAASMLWFAIGY